VINPDTVIPIHRSTFPFYVEPVAEFARRLGASAYRGELVILDEGENWTADGRRS
jgi:L-ascorbate metabolism protein UlaG (beta-lactamase superfamily)